MPSGPAPNTVTIVHHVPVLAWIWSANRSANATNVRLGFPAGDMGKTELSYVYRFLYPTNLRSASTTPFPTPAIRKLPTSCATPPTFAVSRSALPSAASWRASSIRGWTGGGSMHEHVDGVGGVPAIEGDGVGVKDGGVELEDDLAEHVPSANVRVLFEVVWAHVAALVELRPELDNDVERVSIPGGGRVPEENPGGLWLCFGGWYGGQGVRGNDEVAVEDRMVCDPAPDHRVVDARQESYFRGFEGTSAESEGVGGVGPLHLVEQVEAVHAGRAFVIASIKRTFQAALLRLPVNGSRSEPRLGGLCTNWSSMMRSAVEKIPVGMDQFVAPVYSTPTEASSA
ncbi:hypothetical protein CNMCM6069_001168 [Aspergillus lentulus]|nr:hypothetical protein CNMCM6069_001168 [Aspergillus lentulus]